MPFRQAVKLPFDVYGRIHVVSLKGKIRINGQVRPGMIKFGTQSNLFPKQETVLEILGDVVFSGSCSFGQGSSIHVGEKGLLTFGDMTSFGSRTLIYCDQRINIGNVVEMSWKCQIMDTDTHKIIDTLTNEVLTSVKPINIADKCWVGNNVLINKGTLTPSDCVISSNSLCNKDYTVSGNNIIIGGIPAKVISNNKRRVWESKYDKFFNHETEN